MKTYINISAGIAFLISIIFLGCSTTKNTTAVNNITSELVNSRQFTFVARNVMPTEDAQYNVRMMIPNGSNLYQLTSRYDLRVTRDSVIAYLPFFGRSYRAPIDPREGGIKFTSTKFLYQQNMRKKNYEIEITPQDVSDVRKLYLTISQGGYATLRILSTFKSAIGYNGEIEVNK